MKAPPIFINLKHNYIIIAKMKNNHSLVFFKLVHLLYLLHFLLLVVELLEILLDFVGAVFYPVFLLE